MKAMTKVKVKAVTAMVVVMTVAGGELAMKVKADVEPTLAARAWVVGQGGEDWLEGAEFDKAYVRDDGVELLNGYNPANEWWCGSGGQCGALDGKDKKVSFRFTSQLSKTVTYVRVWPFFLNGEPFEIRTGLQADVQGNPTGKWLGSATWVWAPGRWAKEYPRPGYTTGDQQKVKLNKAVKVERGKVYHVVSQYESGNIDRNNRVRFAGVGHKAPDGSVIPSDAVPRTYHGDFNVNYHDPALMALQFDGTWHKDRDREMPWFILMHSDGTYQGQPSWHWREDLWGRRVAGELVRIKNADKKVEQLGVPLRKTGNPQDDLYYEIRDSKGKGLREGILAKKEDILTNLFVWFYADFEPLVLKKGRAYRIVIKTPGTTDPYSSATRGRGGRISTDVGGSLTYHSEVYTKFLPEYALTSYDGIHSVFTLSYDGGKTWETHPCRDMSFRLKLKETLSGSVTSGAKDVEQVSGARWERLKFDGEIPDGTGVDLFVSSSEDNIAWSDFVPVKKGARSSELYALPAGHRKRYMKWRLLLKTQDAKVSPVLTRVVTEA